MRSIGVDILFAADKSDLFPLKYIYNVKQVSRGTTKPADTFYVQGMKQYDMHPAAAHFDKPLFFTRFDLMKWKDYGIMIKYEKRI